MEVDRIGFVDKFLKAARKQQANERESVKENQMNVTVADSCRQCVEVKVRRKQENKKTRNNRGEAW